MKPKLPKTPTEHARRIMRERGYIVIGFPGLGLPKHAGAEFSNWGGGPLDGYVLRVIGRTTKADWLAQKRALFGYRIDTTLYAKWSRFFRCDLAATKKRAKAERERT